MRKNKELIIALGVALLFWILQKKRAFDSLELRPSFPRNFGFTGFSTLTFDLPFTAFNGSDGTLNIGGVDLIIYVEGRRIGRAFSGVQQRILPFGQSELFTQVIINLADLAGAMPGFLGGIQDQSVDFQFRGKLNVEGIYANVDIPVSFNIPKFKNA